MKKTSNRIGAVIASLAVISSAVSFSFTYDPLAYQNAMTANAVSLTAFPEPENKTLSTTSTAPQEITTTTTATYIPELRTTKAYVEGYKQYSVSATVTIMALDENSVTFENAITLENYGTFGFAGIDIYEQLAQYKVGDTVNIYFFYDLDSPDGSPVIQDINALYDYIPPVTTIQPDGESSATVTTTIAVWTRTEPADTTTATDGIYYDLPLEYDSSPMRIGETREIKYSAYYIHSIESTENISYELVENDRGEVEKIIITALSEGDATLVVHLYDSVGIVNINVLSEDYVPPVTTTIATYTVLPEVTTTAVDDDPVTLKAEKQTIAVNETVSVEFYAEWAKMLGAYPDYYISQSDCVTVESTDNPNVFKVTGIKAGTARVYIGFSNGVKKSIDFTVESDEPLPTMTARINVANAVTGESQEGIKVTLHSVNFSNITDITWITNGNEQVFTDLIPDTYQIIVEIPSGCQIRQEYTVSPENTDVTVYLYGEIPPAVTTVMGIETVVMGDSNGDGKVTLADSVAILQYIANREKYPLDEQAVLVSDVCNNGDGISAYDALAIQWYDSKKITSLPINLDSINK